MSKTDWEFINTFSGWVSGLGALLAVVVALYLARRDRRAVLKVHGSTGFRLLPTSEAGDRVDFILINGTNCGHIPLVATNCFSQYGIFRKTRLYFVPPDNPMSSKVPMELGHGHYIHWEMERTDFVDNSYFLHKAITETRLPLWCVLLTYELGFDTSTGARHTGRPDRRYLDVVKEIAKKTDWDARFAEVESKQ